MLRGHQQSQGLVEYALIAATIALAGIAGMGMLTGAEKGYLTGLPLNPAPPSAPGALIHPTSVDPASCTPNPWPLGTPLSCTTPGVVHDTFSNPADRNPPWGTLNWYMGSTLIGTCALPHATGASFNICTPGAFTPPTNPALAGTSQPITVKYENPQSNHVAPTPSTATPFSVVPNYAFNFACANPWQNGWTYRVDVGEPLFCQLTVTDASTGNPAPPGLFVTVTSSGGAGFVYFSCFTNDDPTNGSQHSAAYSALTATDPGLTAAGAPTPGCQPQENQPFSCLTVSSVVAPGLCANNYDPVNRGTTPFCRPPLFPMSACSFVYRRNYDDTNIGTFATTDVLTARAPAINQQGNSPSISIGPSATGPNGTATVAECSPPANVAGPPLQLFARGSGGIFWAPINSDTQLVSSNGLPLTVSCTASVLDDGRNTAFDYPTCANPQDLHCDVDAEQPHSPLGQVTFTVYASPNATNPTGQTYTCPGPGLGHLSSARPYVASLHPLGAWFHASWCTSTPMTFPLGTWYVDVSYGGNAEHAATGTAGGPPALEITINVS